MLNFDEKIGAPHEIPPKISENAKFAMGVIVARGILGRGSENAYQMLEGALPLRMTTRASPTLTLPASALLEAPRAWPAKLVEAHAVTAAILQG